MVYDLVIIGGGPAGVAAGVYAARKKIKTLMLAESFGGQSNVSSDIQNWIGTKSISGPSLSQQLKEHLFAYHGPDLTIKDGVRVTMVASHPTLPKHFTVSDNAGGQYETRTVLVTTGGRRRRLELPGAAEFEQKGITYCASCDGPIFSGKDVAVIGGGNAAFETAAQLAAYCQSVTILERDQKFRAEKITVDKVLANPKVKAFTNVETLEFRGDKFVKALLYQDKTSGEKKELAVEGVFVEIGFVPETDFVASLVKRNNFGSILVDHRTERTSTLGIWAAGDCTDVLYHQNNIAVGDAIKALEDIYLYLNVQA